MLLIPLVFGLVGAITPCALGINAVFLGYVAGKPRPRRLAEWMLFALARAALLTVLGLAFGLLGQMVGGFLRSYQQLIAWGLSTLGRKFMKHKRWLTWLLALSLLLPLAGVAYAQEGTETVTLPVEGMV